MVFTPVLSTPSELDSFLDPDDPVYGFATETWVEPRTYVHPAGEESDIAYQRTANADAFKQHGSPVAWLCYDTLGYYVCTLTAPNLKVSGANAPKNKPSAPK